MLSKTLLQQSAISHRSVNYATCRHKSVIHFNKSILKRAHMLDSPHCKATKIIAYRVSKLPPKSSLLRINDPTKELLGRKTIDSIPY